MHLFKHLLYVFAFLNLEQHTLHPFIPFLAYLHNEILPPSFKRELYFFDFFIKLGLLFNNLLLVFKV